MTVISNKNFTNKPSSEIPMADEYVNCNFTMTAPLIDGDRITGHPFEIDASFTRCNLKNRMPSPDSKLTDCLCIIADDTMIYAKYDENAKEIVVLETPEEVEAE